METIEIHPAPVPPPAADGGRQVEQTEPIETFAAPVLPSPVLEKIRREQLALQETPAAREAKAVQEAKFRSELEAFRRLLPELLQTHRDQYVAIHEGQVVGTGPDQIELADRAYERFGYVPILVTLVTDRPRVVRIPSPRVLRPGDRA
jgi:Family of unknown function (DUF5678)